MQQHLKSLKEPDLLMELIRDIANELDVDTLCHKILVNVSLLTQSDRGSLFLAKGPRGARYLVAKLFDVTPDSVLQDALDAAVDEDGESRIPPIPFGVGIAGHVALTKENVNIKDAYQVSYVESYAYMRLMHIQGPSKFCVLRSHTGRKWLNHQNTFCYGSLLH